MPSWNPDFSHLYVERAAAGHPITERIRERFTRAAVIPVEDYRHVFNRPSQRFQEQKMSMKLVLARKKDGFIYRGSDNAQDFGVPNFYYVTPLLNCLYNCDYCFLQGMYPSANLVLFVNQDDLMQAVAAVAADPPDPQNPVSVAVSYNTDLLAFESVLPLCRQWIAFCRAIPDLLVEIRTKSSNLRALAGIEPDPGTVIAWTLSPRPVATAYEQGAPPPAARLRAAARAIEQGWPVRLCFDPVLAVNGWETLYPAFIREVFSVLDPDRVRDVSIGVFRMAAQTFKAIKRQHPDSDLFYHDYEHGDGLVRYRDTERAAITELMHQTLRSFLPAEKIAAW